MSVAGEIESALDEGDLALAAERAVVGYGPEVLGFLVTFLRDEEDAREAFGQACVDLWAGLAEFRRESSLRTWFYTLARHAAIRSRRAAYRKPGRQEPISLAEDLADRVRTQTLPHLRTEAKTKMSEIRRALVPDDHALLVLRVDRGMKWAEIAAVMADPDGPTSDRPKVEARLRKRFQLVKDDLRERFRAAGLLPEQP